jgi:hypothetical protein
VLAACQELIAEMGRMPGGHVVARRAGVSQSVALNARASLIQAGELPSGMLVADARFRQGLEDPLAERPDDPDAAEIQARIAEVRAEKEATPRRQPGRVARAKLHHATRPGHWRVSM